MYVRMRWLIGFLISFPTFLTCRDRSKRIHKCSAHLYRYTNRAVSCPALHTCPAREREVRKREVEKSFACKMCVCMSLSCTHFLRDRQTAGHAKQNNTHRVASRKRPTLDSVCLREHRRIPVTSRGLARRNVDRGTCTRL